MAKNRRAAAALAFFLALALLFSALFLLFETDHECAGADCPVCSVLALCRETLAGFGLAAPVLLLSLVGAPAARRVLPAARRTAGGLSLVARKVKLLN